MFICLTGFLHGVVCKLIDRVNITGAIHPALFKANGYCIPNFEASAMAFIVVAMKLFYGIDDRTER